MHNIILVDFGSTFTKATVVNREEKRAILSIKYPSTVKIDARISLNKCLKDIEDMIGSENLKKSEKYASSSASGGLRIAVIGLTPSLSIAAARNAAFGAGSKIVSMVTGKILNKDMESIYNSEADIILFCGGYENGNKTIIKHNAKILAYSKLECPIIYGGNSLLAKDIHLLMKENKKDCFLVPNIIPRIGEIDTKSTETIIRDLFMERIIDMKGLYEIRSIFDGSIIPTPAAVLAAGKLLSHGIDGNDGLGDLIIADVGGATTDIHSYAKQTTYEASKLIGAAEPYAKRTVEGDLGMRESSDTLVSEVGIENMVSKLGVSKEKLKESINQRVTEPDFLPDTPIELRIDHQIASDAIHIASRRHAGYLEAIHNNSFRYVQYGKNLSNVKAVIGTGGEIINSRDPINILSNILIVEESDSKLLLPKQCSYYIDRDYVLYAAGLLSMVDKVFAMNVLKNGIVGIGGQ